MLISAVCTIVEADSGLCLVRIDTSGGCAIVVIVLEQNFSLKKTKLSVKL
jgi:hypothetical protein